jgi:hypothetical protein
MKKIIAFALAAVMVLALVACGGDKGPARDSKGYLTEDAAKTFAAQSVGYGLKDVDFTESSFEGDEAGGDENAFFSFAFTDSVAFYTCKVNAIDGTVYDSTAK